MGWFNTGSNIEKDNSDNNQGEIKPEDFKKELMSNFDSKITKFSEEQEEKLSPLMEMAREMKEAREARTRQQQQKGAESNKTSDEEMQELWITNPREAFRRENAMENDNTRRQTQGTAAILMRRETLSGLPYYNDPVIKKEVDELIEAQPLERRADPKMLENAYYVVVGKKANDIRDGKIKQQTSNSSFNGNGTGGNTGREEDEPVSYTAEEKYMMQKFGMNDADVKKAGQELGYV